MRLDLFRKKSVKPTDNTAGLEVVPTEAIPESLPEVVRPAGESYPEVVSVDSVSASYKAQPTPNKDITLEVPFHNAAEYDQPGLEIPSRDNPPFTYYPSQSQSPPQQQSPPQDSSRIDAPTTYQTIVPPYQPPQIHPTQGGPVICAPALWEQRYEPGTNRPYYINHTTKATSWFLPQGDLLESQVDLPPGWDMRFTHDGQRYFLEHATGAVSFKDPRVFKRPTFLQQGQNKTGVKRNQRTGEPLGKLPPGWTRKVDTIGRAYFVDKNGKILSFEDPRSGQLEFERGRALPPETVLYA